MAPSLPLCSNLPTTPPPWSGHAIPDAICGAGSQGPGLPAGHMSVSSRFCPRMLLLPEGQPLRVAHKLPLSATRCLYRRRAETGQDLSPPPFRTVTTASQSQTWPALPMPRVQSCWQGMPVGGTWLSKAAVPGPAEYPPGDEQTLRLQGCAPRPRAASRLGHWSLSRPTA